MEFCLSTIAATRSHTIHQALTKRGLLSVMQHQLRLLLHTLRTVKDLALARYGSCPENGAAEKPRLHRIHWILPTQIATSASRRKLMNSVQRATMRSRDSRIPGTVWLETSKQGLATQPPVAQRFAFLQKLKQENAENAATKYARIRIKTVCLARIYGRNV